MRRSTARDPTATRRPPAAPTTPNEAEEYLQGTITKLAAPVGVYKFA